MNLLLFENTDWIDGTSSIRVRGRQSRHLQTVQRVGIGGLVRVGQIRGRMGTGRVTGIDADSVTLAVDLTETPPAPMPTRLVLALPRPKILHRVLETATTLGIKQFDVVNAWRVDKSYWQSKRLAPRAIRECLWQGLEMSRDTLLPELRWHRFFRDFCAGFPAGGSGGQRLLAHPGATRPLPERLPPPVAFAIGPEGGFIDRELDSLQKLGFAAVSFGPRILPVEAAVTFAVARFGR